MLRRNLGRGRVMEGLELRWALVSNILHALTALGPWRLDGAVGPMHKWYDPRAFDLLSHDEIMTQRAVDAEGAPLHDVRTGDDFLSAGVDVRFYGGDIEEAAGEEDAASAALADADEVVEEGVFCRWMESSSFVMGAEAARW